MKNILLFILHIFSIGCVAQSPIIDITAQNGNPITGAYYKDDSFLLNEFEGTWLYTNGTDSLKIILIKKVLQYNTQYYEDLIIGEYQYIENGVEKVNTLSTINNNYSNQILHSIAGNSVISKTNKPPCNDCDTSEKRLRLMFSEPNSEFYGTMVIRKTTIGLQEAIKIIIKKTGNTYVWIEGTPPPPMDFKIPSGEYTLIKQ
jgi:hypothetical protein